MHYDHVLERGNSGASLLALAEIALAGLGGGGRWGGRRLGLGLRGRSRNGLRFGCAVAGTGSGGSCGNWIDRFTHNTVSSFLTAKYAGQPACY